MTEPKHKSIKVWFSTYRELRKLAAEQPETMAALVDRLAAAERARRDGLLHGLLDTAPEGENVRDNA